MEVLQIQRGCESCCLVLVFGLSSSPVLPRVRAVLDYVRTTAAGDCSPAATGLRVRTSQPAFVRGLLLLSLTPTLSDSKRIDERLKCGWLVAATRVVEEVTVEGWAPVFEDAHEFSAREVLGHVVLEDVRQPHAVERRTDHELRVTDDHGPRCRHGHRFATLLELPPVDGPAGAHAGTAGSGAP